MRGWTDQLRNSKISIFLAVEISLIGRPYLGSKLIRRILFYRSIDLNEEYLYSQVEISFEEE